MMIVGYHRPVARLSRLCCRTFNLSNVYQPSQQQQQQQFLWKQPCTSVLRLTSPQQHRSIFSYLTNLLQNRTEDDDPHANPIIEFLQKHQSPVVDEPISISRVTAKATDHEEITPSKPTFPKFAQMKPTHVQDAYEYVKREQLRLLQQAVNDVTQHSVVIVNDDHDDNSHKLRLDILFQKLDTIIRWIDAIQQSCYTLRQITSFMCTIVVSPSSIIDDRQREQIKSEWFRAIAPLQQQSVDPTAHVTFPIRGATADVVAAAADGYGDDDHVTNVASTTYQWQKLHVELYHVTQSIEQLQSSWPSSPISEHDRSNLLYASQYLIRNYIQETGDDPQQHVYDDHSDSNSIVKQDENETVRNKYHDLSEVMSDIKSNLLQVKSTSVAMPTMKLIYSYLGVRTEQAKLLGYQNVADQILGTNATTSDIRTVQQLHSDMTQRLLPLLRHITEKRAAAPKLALESYLTSRKNSSNQSATRAMTPPLPGAPINQYSIQQHKSDLRSMIRLEKHVTLTGALQFSFRLIQDMFGISIIESSADKNVTVEKDSMWNSNVRLFHCYDTLNDNKYVGSIYIDPFQRKEKVSRPVTIPIVARSEQQEPVVCISLTSEVPTWDTSPAMMTWNDCESLLHELGHALQFVVARPKYGCVLGPQSMPFDISELLPKFMELWMTQRMSIYALIDISKSKTPLADEEIDSAYRVNAREKVLKLAELTYYGTLEMELFSNFDIKGTETILALQERTAEKTMPHLDYDKNDMTALLDIIEENVRGRQVTWYRYLMCEVYAATLLEHLVSVMSTESEAMAHQRMYMRQYLLEPGANVDFGTFRSKLELEELSTDPLWKVHQLSIADNVVE